MLTAVSFGILHSFLWLRPLYDKESPQINNTFDAQSSPDDVLGDWGNRSISLASIALQICAPVVHPPSLPPPLPLHERKTVVIPFSFFYSFFVASRDRRALAGLLPAISTMPHSFPNFLALLSSRFRYAQYLRITEEWAIYRPNWSSRFRLSIRALNVPYTTAERVSLRRDLGRVVQPHDFPVIIGKDIGMWFGPSAAAGALRMIVEAFPAHGLDISAFSNELLSHTYPVFLCEIS
ncbi:hypothetical protein C8R45DRAFT_923343 [Mycena sanguinolenta]|nr:hypothetical protein C8R45DRAFT_923343 [Mycena sanguinolenta]